MRRILLAPLAIACVLVAGTACGGNTEPPGSAGAGVIDPSAGTDPSAGPAGTAQPEQGGQAQQPAANNNTTAASSTWPAPEDCISYNPNNLTVRYEAGIYAVTDGSSVVLRVSGGPGENVGTKALALAKRYRSHCFLGRGNNREEKNQYVFDYWRNPSGMTPAIEDSEDDCSSYNRNNLTVEDMGGGYGWRVKDHDHVLHLFNNESDARNGKLVLSKYSQECSIGNDGDSDDPERVSYHL
jgi:hypothetical protein